MQKYKGEILLFITAILWGSGFIGTEKGLEYFTVFQIMAGRFLVATIILAVIFHKKLKLISSSVLWKGALLGLLLFIAFTLQTFGLVFTTPAKNAFLTALNVIFVPIIAFFIYKRAFDRFEMIAALLAIVGIGFLSLQGSMAINIGDFLSILGALVFAFDIFYTNMFVKKEDALALTIIQFVAASFFSTIAVFFMGEIPTVDAIQNGASIILYLGLFCTTIAYVCQNIGMKYTNSTKSALILSTEALFGTILSVIILHEILSGRMIIGCILILLAIIFAEVKPTLRRKIEESNLSS